MRSMKAVSFLGLVAAIALLLTVAHADEDTGPIPAADCEIVNPWPEVTTCDAYPAPAQDLLRNMPYSTVPAYTQCVRDRCVCTKAAVSPDGWTPAGLYCNTSAFEESGFNSCNEMVDCFKFFWECVLDSLMDRYDAGETLEASELAAAEEIIKHGSEPGAPFAETPMYQSCARLMCEAADSRKNCGLLTCLPNNTQCYEYIKPPPLPNVHQLCTQGCRAALILMALTIATFTSALCCCACCPAPVREIDPLITGQDDGPKRRKDSDAPDSNFDIESEGHREEEEDDDDDDVANNNHNNNTTTDSNNN